MRGVGTNKPVTRVAGAALGALCLFVSSCLRGTAPPVSSPSPAAPPAVAVAETPAASAREYVIRPGDQLDVRFYYHQDLSQAVLVRPDGRITLQLIGDLKAAGLTPGGLKQTLLERYSAHLKDPAIAVILEKAAERRVYVGGEVTNPGPLAHIEGLTCLQAIFAAGGVKRTARLESVVILRDQGTAQPLFLRQDFSRDLGGPAASDNLLLLPNDIVFVPKSSIARLNDFVDQYIEQLLPIQMSFGLTYEMNR